MAFLSGSFPAFGQPNDIDGDGDGFSPLAGDCNDSDTSVFPGAPELCDGKDNDCNNVIDDAVDADGDGFDICEEAPSCDNDPNNFPGNTEVCDGSDNDCDALVDERNNQGDPLQRSCYSGPGGTRNVGLCQDGLQTCSGGSFNGACEGQITPAVEICDGQDNDCNGSADEGFDDDGDGVSFCDGDCDDEDADIFPGNSEVCDNKDNDCDGRTDERNNQGDPLRRSCYTGPNGTRNVGICDDGFQLCTNGSFSGPCDGQTLPGPEICDNQDNDCDRETDEGFDEDGDGVSFCDGDCDDDDPARFPGNNEICDGIDNDCDAMVDERNNRGDPLRRSCYSGPNNTRNRGICSDGTETCTDGSFGICVGEVLPETEICDGEDNDCDRATDEGFDVDGDGVTTCEGDCDDNDPLNFPGNSEACDGRDNDCDGEADENFDDDGDGFTTCGGDCDDTDFNTFPGAPEACDGRDNDCDGDVDEGFEAFDQDNDGFLTCGPNPDCDDDDAEVNPGANEVCDGKDNDCDGRTDERNNQGDPLRRGCYTGPPGTNGVGACDGGNQECIGGAFGACEGEVLPAPESCDSSDNDCDGRVDEDFDLDDDGFTTCGGDCNDGDPTIRPNTPEVCDGLDNDCDGRIDRIGLDDRPLTQPCYTGPVDTAGVGVCVEGVNLCDGSNGFSAVCTDEVTPSVELCDGLDNDCDGEVDPEFDLDEDGFTDCGGDCDDTNPAINPDAMEVCNNLDDDCDDIIDGAQTECYDGPVGTATVGACRPGLAICAEGVPSGTCVGQILPELETCDGIDNDCDGAVDEGFDRDQDGVSQCDGDCDDDNAFVAPNLAERCDCADNDCDGEIDESPFGGSICDFGACHDFDQDNFTNCEGDCNDFSLVVFPGAPEQCGDNIDNDCDGLIDEDVDEDNDGLTTCGGDCDDRFASINVDAVEICDGFDNDCDGMVDEGFDQDGDGATSCAGDCDDTTNLVSPFRQEQCRNGIDDDCDGLIDPEVDADGDGFFRCGASPELDDCNDFNAAVYPGAPEVCDFANNGCESPTPSQPIVVDEGFDQDGDGFEVCRGDCDDNDASIHPNARDIADGIDNNCDGRIDEGDVDNDEDNFTFLCGDCNDNNPRISPQEPDVCDGIDNDCDGRVDQDPLGRTTCTVCRDDDEDGILSCEGDCDDEDPTVGPTMLEVCDGKDNDCDGTIDLDRVFGEELCISADMGVPMDIGMGSGGGSVDAGGGAVAGPPDAGVSPASPSEDEVLETLPLDVNCGCSTAEEESSAQPSKTSWLLASLMIMVLFWRRRRHSTAIWLAALSLTSACSEADVGAFAQGLADIPGSGLNDSGAGDGSVDSDLAVDAGSRDSAGALDLGDLTSGPCRLADPGRITTVDVPDARLQLALDVKVTTSAISDLGILTLDAESERVRGFVLTAALEPGFDPQDPSVAAELLDALIEPLFSGGVTGVAESVDETFRQSFVLRTLPAARTLRRVRMVNDVLPSRIRDGLVAQLTREELEDIPDLPEVSNEVLTREFVLAVLSVVDPETPSFTFVVSLADLEAVEAQPLSATLLQDLSNGTHVADTTSRLGLNCEDQVAEPLRVDFLWVVDNSNSMREEQQALADVAGTFFDALEVSGVDFRLGVVTTDGETLRGGGFTNSLTEFQTRVQVGQNGIGREAGLEFAVRAVERARDAVDPEEAFRSDAVPVIIFFSDEDAENLQSVEVYAQALGEEGVLPFAIVGPRPRGCTAVGRGVAAVGESYIQVTEALNGSSASICAANLDDSISEILVAAAGAASTTQLQEQPISGSIEVQLGSDRVARSRSNGFDYEPTANSVLFFGEANLPVGTDFRVAYRRFVPFEN